MHIGKKSYILIIYYVTTSSKMTFYSFTRHINGSDVTNDFPQIQIFQGLLMNY